MQLPTSVSLWGRDLTAAQLSSLERLCPVVDRAAQEVAFRWGLPDIRTRVWCEGPGQGELSVELVRGPGPGGLRGHHDASGVKVWGAGYDDDWHDFPQRLSHELWETMVNPTGRERFGVYAAEVVDPVSVTPWLVRGPAGAGLVALSNFVFPAYFGWNTVQAARDLRHWRCQPPYDHLGLLKAPGHPEPGAYQTVNGELVAGPPLPPHYPTGAA